MNVFVTLPLLTTLGALLTGAEVWRPARQPDDYLLPNGEPIVGVYYYPWYRGEPFNHVGWHPEFQYDNINRRDHMREVIRAMADHGINQASYSYWGDQSLDVFQTHIAQAEELLHEGWPVYFSPYMEPPTVDKRFAEPSAQQFTADRFRHFLAQTGRSPAFCRLGDEAFINVYVAYYQPTESDADLREFLQRKYGTIDKLRSAWKMHEYADDERAGAVEEEALPRAWDEIVIARLPRGTVAFADLQELRAQRLEQGWRAVMEAVKRRTGIATRFTGDNSNTIVSPTRYMQALTGLTWYSFGYALTQPTRRPKLISEIAKYTGTTFLYTIAPGYVDRQQRWPGFHLEHDPFYYEFAWVKALQTLPEGIMILTHSEWFEGSIIDVTKEYGRRPYEATELYASVYKAAFRDAFAHKRKRKPVAVVFNEWATYYLHERGHNLGDVYGLIKALECLSVDFDVVPETYLSAAELEGRRVVLVPSCGASLHPDKLRLLAEWAARTPGARLIVDATDYWKRRASDPSLAGRVVVAGERLGRRLSEAFDAAWRRQQVPVSQLRYFEQLLLAAVGKDELWPERDRPSSSYEVARGPVVWAGNTAVVTAANTIPYSYLVHCTEHPTRAAGEYFADTTCPWQREKVVIKVALPSGRVPRQVQLLDSDAAPWPSTRDPSGFFTWEYDAATNVVSISTKCKFHALFAIVTGQAALRPEAAQIYPGGSVTLRVQITNHDSRRPLVGTLTAAGPPDLKIEPAKVKVGPRQRATVGLKMTAGPDCAVGKRTLRLELKTTDGAAVCWVPLQVSEPALLGLKTSTIAVVREEPRQAVLVVGNVGKQPATNVTIRVGKATSSIPVLKARQDATVSLTVKASTLEPSVPLPDELSWEAARPPRENGLRLLSGADGVVAYKEQAGALGVTPDPEQPPNNVFIYFAVDKSRVGPGDYAAEAEIEYFDAAGSFIIEYDSAFGDEIEDRYHDSRRVSLNGTGRWKTVVIDLERARFAGRQNLGADFRISGRLLVRRVVLRPAQRRARISDLPVELSWRCGAGRFSTTARLRLVSLPAAPQAPDVVRGNYMEVWVCNPYGTAVPELPVVLPLSHLDPALRQGPVSVHDTSGRTWPTETAGDCLQAIVPVSVTEPLFISQGAGATDLAIRDRSADLGYVAAQNDLVGALWDAQRGGTLMSLMCMADKADYASPSAGACTVEYTLPDGSHEVSSSWPGRVRVAKVSPAWADIIATADGPAMTVTDRWRIHSSCRLLRLQREIVMKTALAAADFCPLVIRLAPQFFDRVLPLGVGFTKDNEPPRGWLETWHSEGWYFAFSGDQAAAKDALAIAVGRLDGLRRIRYGFIPADDLPEAADPRLTGALEDELQFRFRAQCDYPAALPNMFRGVVVPGWWRPGGRRIYRPGEKLSVEVLMAVARGLSWRYAQELALCEKYGLSISFGPEPPAGGKQMPQLEPPQYMYRVNPPRPSCALPVQRTATYAPEMVLPGPEK